MPSAPSTASAASSSDASSADPIHTVVDLRSDTVTTPTAAMREAMAGAEVGDDVLGDDPTVLQLQDEVAALFGKEAGCFVPSGTMANATAIRAHTQPGDEIVGHESSHFYQYESGGFAAMCGCSVRFVPGERGMFTPDAMEQVLRPRNDHFPHSRLVVMENTSNRGGGSIWPLEQIRAVADAARRNEMRVHLDGARVWNACIASGLSPADYAAAFDTVSACFSKGLGAPVGSIVVGDAASIARVKRFRKMFGGTMRQSGVLAAAALYAVRNHFDRLAEDHAKAQRFAQRLARVEGIAIDPAAVETNIVYFDIPKSWGTAAAFSQALDQGRDGVRVRMFPTGPQRLRAVMHLDVAEDAVMAGADLIARMIESGPTQNAEAKAATIAATY